ncbi:MAG: helix-turn-helix transcriptional regulator [Bacillales bacterium]|nr:helix-turn-helix transcriptional regulator [Bacillales bacterium]MDD6808047.1 helix-turn-helix transcriptional regulator [Oscillospiraceae bacterium]
MKSKKTNDIIPSKNTEISSIEVEEKLRKTIAINLIYYRKLHEITQVQLAELLNYSDKAVSKWERGDGVPDIYILNKLAKIYNITVNDLIYEHKKKKPITFFRNRFVISLLSFGLVWFIATIFYVIFKIIKINVSSFNPKNWELWYLFIYAIPSSSIVALVFSKLWGKRWHRFFEVSGIIWGVGLIVFLQLKSFNVDNAYLFWFICVAFEVLTLLWYCLRRKKKEDNQ